ncbi:MAG TPA: aspartate aminotransferase family protein [Beijerinckiaceae bacterium]|nr:aspartate aminotransferase family protein [Beijerinckiaceae bacterium]
MSSPLLPTYARIDLAFERGDGAWLEGSDGKRYLDFGGGIAVASLGYSHPRLVSALIEQGQKVWHTSNLFRIPEGERLAQRLVDATFADLVFFTNSGAEAVECAIKMARKYHATNGAPERFRLITFEGAFHGRTLAAIAATGNAKYLEGFGPKVDGFDQVAFDDFEAVEAAVGAETAGILIEPIFGEGGVRVVAPQFLRRLRELCDRHGLLLVFDEVQSGVGRSGRLFAYERAGAVPDIMAIAKGIGGGFPLGACLATAEAASGMKYGSHGTTYGGNPLAMAVGNAVLDVVLEPGFLDHVAHMGLLLRQRLAGLQDSHPDLIEEIRGEGLLLGLRLKPGISNTAFVDAARAEQLLVISAGDNVVRLLPPLIIGESEIEEGLRRLSTACEHLQLEISESAA